MTHFSMVYSKQIPIRQVSNILINVCYSYLWNFQYLLLPDLYVIYFIMVEKSEFFSEWK
jgi:hypothetical protein